MRTFVAAPRTDGPHPGVLFYTDIFQLTEASLRWAVRLAGYGFVGAAPGVYHRVGEPGPGLGLDDPGKARGPGDAEALPPPGPDRGAPPGGPPPQGGPGG